MDTYIQKILYCISNPSVVYNKNTVNLELSVEENCNIIDASFKEMYSIFT